MHSQDTGQRIELKNRHELDKLKISGGIAAEILERLKTAVKAGVSTMALEKIAGAEIKKHKCASAFLGYRGYPAATCISLNQEVVHGIPSEERIITEGDIVSIDVGILFDGFYGDNALSVIAGKASCENERLLLTTERALYNGIDQAVIGNRLGDISSAIQQTAEKSGFSVVRDFVGHGIGREMHEQPQIPNYGTAGTGPRLEAGMVLALEPMINMGGYEVKILSDNWTVITVDGKNSGHFEHMVAITQDGPEILTKL
ncbi:MAG: type I methionyl aminopeptidase [bacterium]